MSKKHAAHLREYSKLRAAFLAVNPYCQWWMESRGIRTIAELHERGGDVSMNTPLATDIHHKKGRGKYLNDTSTWMAVSREGHNWIHNHPKEAYEKGWMVARRD